MWNSFKILLFSFSILFFLESCQEEKHKKSTEEEKTLWTAEEVSLSVKYAQTFTIENLSRGHRVKIFNPSNRKLLQILRIIPRKSTNTDSIKPNEILIKAPITKAAFISDTFVGALEILNARDCLLATSDTTTLYDKKLKEKARLGKLHSVAKTGIPDIEKIINLGINVVMMNYYNGNSFALSSSSKIPPKIIYNNDWQETSLLARAEWIKVIGLLVGRGKRADSLFTKVEKEYNRLKTIAKKGNNKPSVFFGNSYQGSWYLPEKDSYVAKMIADAGGIYKAPECTKKNIGWSFEYVLQEHSKDDIWITWQSGTIKDLKSFASLDNHYKQFNAYQKGQLYLNDARAFGNSNDYFEKAPYYPHLILKDLIAIFHPELIPSSYQLTYWRCLKSSSKENEKIDL